MNKLTETIYILLKWMEFIVLKEILLFLMIKKNNTRMNSIIIIKSNRMEVLRIKPIWEIKFMTKILNIANKTIQVKILMKNRFKMKNFRIHNIKMKICIVGRSWKRKKRGVKDMVSNNMEQERVSYNKKRKKIIVISKM